MNVRTRNVLICVAIAVFAGLVLAVAMPRGPGVSRDSGQYFRYALILRGQVPLRTEEGVAVAVTHYPPLYPTMLAALEKARLSPMTSARLINVVCYALTCGLASAILLRHGRGTGRAVAAGLLLMIQPAMAFIHLWVVSEPPFLLLTVIVFGLLLEYARRPDDETLLHSHEGRPARNPGLVIAVLIGACLGVAGLTRYVGVALVPAACWLVWRTGPHKRRLLNAVVLAVMAAIPLIVMGVVQRHVAGEVAHRDVGFEPLNLGHLQDLLTTIGGWFVAPDMLGKSELFGRSVWTRFNEMIADRIGWSLAGVAFVVMVAVMIGYGRRTAFRRVAVTLSAVYFALLCVSITFFDHGTPFDDRILAPVAVLLTLWFVADFPKPAAASLPLPVRVLACAAVALIVVSGAARAATDFALSNRYGLGFNNIVYRDSPLVAACAELPIKANIFSNYAEPITLHTGHPAWVLPGKSIVNGMMPPEEKSITMDRLSRNGYVAFFSHRPNKKLPGQPMTIDEILATYPLKAVKRTKDGTLFKWRGPVAKKKGEPATQDAADEPAGTQP